MVSLWVLVKWFKTRGLLGSIFAGYVPLASQNPHPIIVYSVAIYRPHLSHFWPRIRLPIFKSLLNRIFLPQKS